MNNHNLYLARRVCDRATDCLMSVKNILITIIACTGCDLRCAICALNGIVADDIVHLLGDGVGVHFISFEIVRIH